MAWLRVSIAVLAGWFAGCGADPGKVALGERDRWPARAPLPVVGADGWMVVTDGNSDTLSFVDVAKGVRALAAPVGLSPVEPEGPHHLVVSPDRRRIYVNLSGYVTGSASGPHGAHGAGTAPGHLIALDAHDLSLVGQVEVRANPGDLAVSRDGQTVYVSHYNLAEVVSALNHGTPAAELESFVARIHTADFSVDWIRVGPGGHGLLLSEDEQTLFVACALADELAVVDLGAEPPAVRRVRVSPTAGGPGNPSYEPYAVARAPDGLVWISNVSSSGHSLSVYDPQAGAILVERAVFLQSAPQQGVFVGGTLVVPAWSPDVLLFVEAASGRRENVPLPTDCLSPHVFTTASGRGFVVCEGNRREPGALLPVDLATHAFGAPIALGVYPNGAAWLPAP